MSVPHEEAHVFAVESPNMATAVMAINKTATAYLLLHIVPSGEPPFLWLVFKADSWAREQWRKHFPDAVVLTG